MVELLLKAGIEFTSDVCEDVEGSLAMLHWLAYEAQLPPSSTSYFDDYMGYALTGTTPKNSKDLREAVQMLVEEFRNGSLDISIAARRGHLPVVQYLVQQYSEDLRNSELLVLAAEAGCEAMVGWLVELAGSLDAEVGASLYVAAARTGNQVTLATLRRLGVPLGAQDLVVQAVRLKCAVPGLRWLAEQGAPVGSRSAMVAAIEQNNRRRHRPLSAEEVAWLQGLAEEDQAAAAAPGSPAGPPDGQQVAASRAITPAEATGYWPSLLPPAGLLLSMLAVLLLASLALRCVTAT